MTPPSRSASRVGAVVAALAVALAAPVPALADTPVVDLQVEPTGHAPWADPHAVVQVAVHASSPDHDEPVELRATFDFGNLHSSLQVDTGSGCAHTSGSRYRCSGQVTPGGSTTIGIAVTARADRARTSGTVNVTVEAVSVDSNRATTGVLLEVVSNRVDLSVTSNSGRSYKMVGPSARPVGAVVNYPNLTWLTPLRVTFDFSEVSHRFHVVGSNALSGETCTGSGSRYECVREARGRDGVEFFGGVRVAPRAGAPPGPSGQVRISVTQDGGVDPNPSNNTYRMTLDVATGSTQVRVDVGEATGRIGETVTVPVTMRNLGPDTVEWMGISNTPLTGGLELVGLDGCVSGVPGAGSLCTGGQWMRGGTHHQVGMRVKIHRCHDGHSITPTVSTSNGTIIWNPSGAVHVVACGGAASGGGTGSASGGGGATPDPMAGPTIDAAVPTPPTPATAIGATTAVDGTSTAVPAGDLAAVAELRQTDTGLGLGSLLLLLGLLVAARSVRWALVRHAGIR